MSVSTWFESPFVRAFLVLAACATLPLGPSLAAADEPKAPKPVRNWSIEIAPGASIGGPLDDMKDAMAAAGFDDDVDLGSWGVTHYPSSASDSTAIWGAACRRFGDSNWLIGVGGGWTNFGSVSGNRNVEGEPLGIFYLYSEVEMLTIAPMAWYQPLPAARLGAGLALHRVDTQLGRTFTGEVDDSSSWEPGILVEAAVTYPPASRFYFLLLVQYRWLQDGTVGPWQGTASSGEVVVFPESEIALSHGLGAVGLGIRF